jgi:hypothetical protein
MTLMRELLSRIRWDPEFARGSFQLGYYDRTEDRVIMVPFKEVTLPPGSPGISNSPMRKEGTWRPKLCRLARGTS